MAFRQPTHPELLKAALPHTRAETYSQIKLYGQCMYAAEAQGDEQMVEKCETVLIHLRYRFIQLDTVPPSYEDLCFIRIYEANYSPSLHYPSNYGDLEFEKVAITSFGPPVEATPPVISSELQAAREQLIADMKNASLSVNRDDCDSDDSEEYFSDSDSDSVYSDCSFVEDLEAGFQNPEIEDYINDNCGEIIGCSDIQPANNSAPLSSAVKTIVDRVATEHFYQLHSGISSSTSKRQLNAVRRATNFLECPEELNSSLLQYSSDIDLNRYGNVLFYAHKPKSKDVNCLSDLSMRSYVRKKLVSCSELDGGT